MNDHQTSQMLSQLLGIPGDTPLSIEDMRKRLRAVVHPAPERSPLLERFTLALCRGMQEAGIALLSEDDASGGDGRFLPGTVVFAPGRFPDELLPINRVSTLYNNIIVGIYDEVPPLTESSGLQERLDAIVGWLAREMVHILIFVTPASWTICTMNGGVVRFEGAEPSAEDILKTLVPKLTAQVVPPRPADFDVRHGELATRTLAFRAVAEDFTAASRLWRGSGWLLSHTSTEGLDYRNDFYRRIVSRYLDRRSGMSYGFLARQLPFRAMAAAIDTKEGDGHGGVSLAVAGERYRVPVPEVRVITTRSGCRKDAIDAGKDLVEIGMKHGRPYLATPEGSLRDSDIRPSFDTLTILAHAIGNAMMASLITAIRQDWSFPRRLAEGGASMTHWHSYPEAGLLPEGYPVHGRGNPPVSCSTPQSAAYSLTGKVLALEQALAKGKEYLGDIHVEPNHGTNIVGVLSLAETARFLNHPDT